MEAALKTPPREVVEPLFVRPYRLVDGAASGHWHCVDEDFAAPVIIRYTTRADVAECVVQQAETWPGSKVVNVFTGGV